MGRVIDCIPAEEVGQVLEDCRPSCGSPRPSTMAHRLLLCHTLLIHADPLGNCIRNNATFTIPPPYRPPNALLTPSQTFPPLPLPLTAPLAAKPTFMDGHPGDTTRYSIVAWAIKHSAVDIVLGVSAGGAAVGYGGVDVDWGGAFCVVV